MGENFNIAEISRGQQPVPAETNIAVAAPRRPRLWPGLCIIALMWAIVIGTPMVMPGTMAAVMLPWFAPAFAAALFVLWWLLISRTPWIDRFLILLGGVALGVAAYYLRDSSFTGMGELAFFLKAVPVVITVWAVWLLFTFALPWSAQRIGLMTVLFLAWGYFTLLRFEGTTGSMAAEMPFRWSPTAEDRLQEYQQAKASKAVVAPADAKSLELQAGDWPGFRGTNRDSRLTGVRIATDWEMNPPRELWRHPVGPGWSSFAVIGSNIYTQEQRGPDETVVCYDSKTGSELWSHKDAIRFTEAIGGPGPRATPTFHAGKIYALGATGKLNCLDAATGKAYWSRDIVRDSGRKSDAKVPIWGFASSPLVFQDIVTVFAGGPDKKSALGYNAKTGELQWHGGEGQDSYSSLQHARLGDVDQLLLATEKGVTAFDPKSGAIVWDYPNLLEGGMTRIVQPALVDSGVLVPTGIKEGARRLQVSHASDHWDLKENWKTTAIKPYFNDLVIHKGYLYGFDGAFFTCVNLDKGKSQWRERGYGSGQVLLLADQDLLLILSESGEAVLVDAKPDSLHELSRFQALQGKTWNHPVVAHGMLFVRNGKEAACYQLTELK